MKNNRILYLDIIKVFSALMVILIHLVSIKWYVIDLNNVELNVLNFFNVIARVSVPLFVMISGYFMLSKPEVIGFKELFFKYILRIVVIIVIWSVLYALISIMTEINNYSFFDVIKQIIYRSIQGPVHFWYLYMLVGLYIITPFIQMFIKNRKLEEAFIIIGILFLILKSLKEVVVIDTLELYLLYLNFTFTSGYIIYYVLGHYLNTYDVSKKVSYILYTLGILSFVYTFVLTLIYTFDSELVYDGFLGYLRPNTMFSSIATFLFFKQILENKTLSQTFSKIITYVSRFNFGVFIVHNIFVGLIGRFGLMDIGISYIILLPILTILVYLLSLATTFVLSKVKIFKYII